MEQKIMMSKAKEQIKGVYVKYAMLLFIFTLLSSMLNTFVPVKVLMEQPLWYFPYLILMILLIIVHNTIYFLFIKRVRKEVFQKKDIQYSFSKTGLHVLTAILFELIQVGVLMLAQLVGSFVPILIIPLMIFMQVMMSSASVFIAFAIYDGVKGALNIVNGSLRLMKKYWKTIFQLSLPLLIWMLLNQLGNNFLTSMMTSDYTLTIADVLTNALASETLQIYAIGWIVWDLLNFVVSSFILVPLYMAFANLYEQAYLDFYPFQAVIHTNVIDIEE